MKVDWKKLAQSPGYKSLKAAYIRDVRGADRHENPVRDRTKQTSLRLFQRVIRMAQHYAIRTNVDIDLILNEWEEGRDYWWRNYYSEHRLKKLPSGKPRNVQIQRPETYYREINTWLSSEVGFKKARKERTRLAKLNREQVDGKKPRWGSVRKHRARNIRELRKRQEKGL